MRKFDRSLGLLTCFLAALPLSCSSPVDSSERDVPLQVESGFEFLDDAFVFENYGGAAVGPQLTPDLVGRMFGPENVCLGGELPCELNPVAEGWMNATNSTLNEGRSEGFAVTSLMFHAGELAPQDFGGETVADLRLFGNQKLQEEIAYWAATQAVPSAVANDVRYQAKDVLPFLAEVLQPDSDKHYRLAIAQRTETGFARGHAVTPIGYYKGEGDVYWLRIYDNNFPDKERRIEINPVANTWRYEIPSIDDDEPIVYEGTTENGNYLYFSAVEDRMGVLKAPFAPGSGVVTINYSSITAVAQRGDRETGIRDGEVLEADGDRVVPAFSACPRCGANVPIINQTLIDQGVVGSEPQPAVKIVAEGEMSTKQGTGTGGRDSITGSGSGYVTTVYPEGDVSEDSVTFSEGGSTTYESGSGNDVEISTQTARDDTFYSFTVSVEGSDDPDTDVTVKITTDENGETVIEVENLPEGKEVTVSVRRVDSDGSDDERESATFKSNGGTSTATINPAEEKIIVQNADEVTGGSCNNGQLDAEFETDVDCGGECGPCVDGEACTVDADCEGGTCVGQDDARVCRATQCYDQAKNGEETDVDCGGSLCGPCAATADQRTTPECVAASDCDTGHCLDGRCRRKQSVVVTANRLPPDGETIRYSLDGVSSSLRMQSDALEGPHQYVLGEAYKYQVSSVEECSTDLTEQTTGITADGDQELGGVIDVDCPDQGGYPLSVHLFYDARLQRVPANDPMTIALTIDGVRSEITLSGEEGEREEFATFSDSWSAEFLKGPVSDVEKPWDPNQPNAPTEMGSYDCSIIPWASNSGDTYMRHMYVNCDWAPLATCSDGIKNRDESDVDCGGTKCSGCAENQQCFADSDCGSAAPCESGLCGAAGSCDDGVQNQDETDVDCGGATCGGCADQQACSVSSDCASNYCTNDVCATATCSDSVQNQDESDVDCGGTICGGCADQQACSVASDCTSNYCLNNVCDTATCSDSVQNQDESDIDCGGVCSNTCASGDSCNANSDCASDLCTNNVCVASCSDGIQNQDETGVDCGGSTCGGCGTGSICTLDAECSTNNCECGASSGNCAGNTGTCGAAKLVVDQPTTDGVTVSGTFTVPAQCTQVYVQAWGAAGGSGSSGGGGGPGFPGTPGGAGGYVSGTLSVSAGDVIDAWVGQGGDFGVVYDFGGTPGIGSKYGVSTSGGLGDGDSFTGGGGGGGGLTSVQVTGSTTASFVLPAGGGGTDIGRGDDVAAASGGGAVDSNGEDGPIASGEAGGGAGEVGGSYLGSNGGAAAGTYGTYPTGFTTADGLDGVPANTTAPDYSLCEGISQGSVGAGSNELGSGFNAGGDGCVVLRCVAP